VEHGLTPREKHRLKKSEKMVLRRILSLRRVVIGVCIILYNEELQNMQPSFNIMRIKSKQ
jgi:hypothetical protein